MKNLSFLALFLAIAPLEAQPATDPEAAAIRQTALDYIEGWYEGDATRMERSLHPELAKRIVMTDIATGNSRLDSMSAMTLVQRVRAGGGRKTPKMPGGRTSRSSTASRTPPSSRSSLRAGSTTSRSPNSTAIGKSSTSSGN